jgi:hypothetical protein
MTNPLAGSPGKEIKKLNFWAWESYYEAVEENIESGH